LVLVFVEVLRVCANLERRGVCSRRFLATGGHLLTLIHNCHQYEILQPYLADDAAPGLKGKDFFWHFVKLRQEAAKYRNTPVTNPQ
jgi:hypothetical protein